INENECAEGILVERNRVVGVQAANQTFAADKVVVATGAWTSLIELGELALPVEVKPIRGQMISFRTSGTQIKRVIYGRNGYLVRRGDGRVLEGATVEDAGFDKRTTGEGILRLREIAEEIAPSIRDLDISDKWAGLRPMASDGLPIIGAVPSAEGLFI